MDLKVSFNSFFLSSFFLSFSLLYRQRCERVHPVEVPRIKAETIREWLSSLTRRFSSYRVSHKEKKKQCAEQKGRETGLLSSLLLLVTMMDGALLDFHSHTTSATQ